MVRNRKAGTVSIANQVKNELKSWGSSTGLNVPDLHMCMLISTFSHSALLRMTWVNHSKDMGTAESPRDLRRYASQNRATLLTTPHTPSRS